MPVIDVAPAFLSVNERLAEEPRFTDPNASAEGVICNCDCAPTPVRATPRGRGAAEVPIDSVPVRVPPCDGAKVTCSVQLAPAASVPLG